MDFGSVSGLSIGFRYGLNLSLDLDFGQGSGLRRTRLASACEF